MTVRPGKKFGFQSAAENLQRRRRSDWLQQTVPNRCSSRWKGVFANGRTQSAWNDQRWCSRRAQSSTCVEVWHALKIWGQVARSLSMKCMLRWYSFELHDYEFKVTAHW